MSGAGRSPCNHQCVSGGQRPRGVDLLGQDSPAAASPSLGPHLKHRGGGRGHLLSPGLSSLQALTRDKLRGTAKLSNTAPHSTEGGAEASRKKLCSSRSCDQSRPQDAVHSPDCLILWPRPWSQGAGPGFGVPSLRQRRQGYHGQTLGSKGGEGGGALQDTTRKTLSLGDWP